MPRTKQSLKNFTKQRQVTVPLSRQAQAVRNGHPAVKGYESSKFQGLEESGGMYKERWQCMDCDRVLLVSNRAIGVVSLHARKCPVATARQRANDSAVGNSDHGLASSQVSEANSRSTSSITRRARGQQASGSQPPMSSVGSQVPGSDMPAFDPRVIPYQLHAAQWSQGGFGTGYQPDVHFADQMWPMPGAIGAGSDRSREGLFPVGHLAAGPSSIGPAATENRVQAPPPVALSSANRARAVGALAQLRSAIASLEGRRAEVSAALQPLLDSSGRLDQQLAHLKAQMLQIETLFGTSPGLQTAGNVLANAGAAPVSATSSTSSSSALATTL
ncbi:hypothetical protein V8E36_001700 [Tilletia maclaganii]